MGKLKLEGLEKRVDDAARAIARAIHNKSVDSTAGTEFGAPRRLDPSLVQPNARYGTGDGRVIIQPNGCWRGDGESPVPVVVMVGWCNQSPDAYEFTRQYKSITAMESDIADKTLLTDAADAMVM